MTIKRPQNKKPMRYSDYLKKNKDQVKESNNAKKLVERYKLDK